MHSRWHTLAMARANGLNGQGAIFHVTHRCLKRNFLLKSARDRDGYSLPEVRKNPTPPRES